MTRAPPARQLSGGLAGWLAAIFLLFVLQACGGGGQPFSKSTAPTGKTPPPITVVEMKGIPADKARVLTEFMAEAAGKRDIAIVQGGAFGDGYRLDGSFTAKASAQATILGYQWTLADSNGQLIHSFSGAELAGAAKGDPWSAAVPDVLRRMAVGTAENLASRLSQLGFATQTAGIPPPFEAFATADADAARKLDLETLYGPQAAAEVTTPASYETVESAPLPTLGTEKPASGRAAIRAIAVTQVIGAPGTGNDELKSALKKVLKNAGWPVVDRPQNDALTVTGEVNLGPKTGETQKVALAWKVATAEGRELGSISQANTVPSGSLDRRWGDIAPLAAQAAAEGLFDLVNQVR